MTKKLIMKRLKEVKDPEIGFSIVDMGLIYDVGIEGKDARIEMTLTTPTCPMGGRILSDVEGAVKKAGYKPSIELVFDPPWGPERMSDEIRKKLKKGRWI